jgi:hypothetical protein
VLISGRGPAGHLRPTDRAPAGSQMPADDDG